MGHLIDNFKYIYLQFETLQIEWDLLIYPVNTSQFILW